MCLGPGRGSGSVSLIHYLHPAKMDGLAGLQGSFLDRGAIDVSAIGRAEIPDDGRAVIEDDLAVGARNGRVLDFKVVGCAATEGIASRVAVESPKCSACPD